MKDENKKEDKIDNSGKILEAKRKTRMAFLKKDDKTEKE